MPTAGASEGVLGTVRSDPARDDSYVDRFGEHATWNDLHTDQKWVPPSPTAIHSINDVPRLQRQHFIVFFSVAHHFTCPPPCTINVPHVLGLVVDGLRKMASSCLWLRLQWVVRGWAILRRRTRQLREGAAARRRRVMEEWLEYWRDAEAKVQLGLRKQLRTPRAVALFSPERVQSHTLANAITGTPEGVKAKVLWELYWLVAAQEGRRELAYWTQHFALVRLRERLRAKPFDYYREDFVEFQPDTVRAANAALFILALKRPRWQCTAGKHLRLRDLTRLANAPNTFHDRPPATPPALRFASPTLLLFLELPLCRDAAWLTERYLKPNPLLCRMNWSPPPPPERKPSVAFTDFDIDSPRSLAHASRSLSVRFAHRPSALLPRKSLPFDIPPGLPQSCLSRTLSSLSRKQIQRLSPRTDACLGTLRRKVAPAGSRNAATPFPCDAALVESSSDDDNDDDDDDTPTVKVTLPPLRQRKQSRGV